MIFSAERLAYSHQYTHAGKRDWRAPVLRFVLLLISKKRPEFKMPPMHFTHLGQG